MWRGDVPAERNPMTLVTVRGATKRTNAPRSLTFEEFQKFVSELPEPFRTMALLCLCLGLRISECLALKWADIDWLASKISVERAIVRQRVDDVKTAGSRSKARKSQAKARSAVNKRISCNGSLRSATSAMVATRLLTLDKAERAPIAR